MQFEGNIFITGGSGSLGQAFMQKAQDEEWPCRITVYSRDWKKQLPLKKKFPEVTFVIGDILSFEQLKMAMAGHDMVIHMAAMKHIVIGEEYALATIENNVDGSRYVCQAAVETNVKHVIGISTDKAASPVNAYGASKMLMERIFQNYAKEYPDTQFHLTRYGNVWASAGSFFHNWKNDMNTLGYVRSTVSTMTRFWLTMDEALELVYLSQFEPSGCAIIPRAYAAKIGDIEKWLIPEGVEIVYIGSRNGEKQHECLLSEEEGMRAEFIKSIETGERFIRLRPADSPYNDAGLTPRYSSAKQMRMTKEQFFAKFDLTGDELRADDHS